jgi:YD repeat-containing protein
MKPLRLFLVVVLVLQISLLQIWSQAFASGYICDGWSINYDATTADAICNGTLLDPSQQTITSYSGNYTANPIWSYGSSFSLSGSTDLLAASGFTSAIGFYDTHFSFAGFSDNLLDSNQFTGHIGSYGTKFSFAGFSDNLLNKSLFTWWIGSYGTHFSFAGFNEDLLAPSKFTGAIGYYKDSLFMAVKDPSLSVIWPDPLSIQLAWSTNTPERVINWKTNNAKTTTIQTQSDALDPVDLSTWDFTYDNTLMHIAWIGLPYDLSINYQSQAYYDWPIGFGWDHSYNQKLIENADGSVTYMDGHLGTHTFIPSWDGFEYLDGLNANLQKDQNWEYIMSFKNKSLYHFGANKFIQNISNQNGNVLSFSYDSFNRLTSVVDTVGRTIQYTYYDSNRLKRVTDFSGRYVEFSYYDGATNDWYLYDLKNITIHNGNEAEKNISFTYTKDETEPKLAHNIKTMTDSKGQVYVTNTYDENDRVTSQIYGDGSGSYDYTLADIH